MEQKLSYKLISARLSAGLTQKELAEKLGIFQQNISQYENGTRTPKLKRLQEIAIACNVPISSLINY